MDHTDPVVQAALALGICIRLFENGAFRLSHDLLVTGPSVIELDPATRQLLLDAGIPELGAP